MSQCKEVDKMEKIENYWCDLCIEKSCWICPYQYEHENQEDQYRNVRKKSYRTSYQHKFGVSKKR